MCLDPQVSKQKNLDNSSLTVSTLSTVDEQVSSVDSTPSSDSSDRVTWRRMPRGLSTKGLHIHICSALVDGRSCGKIFTRKEHLRRHQLNHSNPQFPCQEEGCSHAFHRLDLLQRHAHRDHGSDGKDLQITPVCKSEEKDVNPKQLGFRASNKMVLGRDVATHNPMSLISNTWGGRDSTEARFAHHYLRHADELYIPTGLESTGRAVYWLESIQRVVTCADHGLDLALSMACAHMSRTQYDRQVAQISTKYYLKALRAHRQAVHEFLSGRLELSKERLEAELFVALIIGIRCYVTFTEDSERGASNEDLFKDYLVWIECARGFSNTLKLLLPHATDTEFYRILIAPQKEVTDKANIQFLTPSPLSPSLNIPYLRYLLMDIELETIDPAEVHSYNHAVQIVDFVYHSIIHRHPKRPPLQIWMTSICSLSAEYTSLLRKRRSRAIAIIAHLIVVLMLPEFSSIWWHRGNMVRKIEALAAFVTPDWAWALGFPMLVARDELQMQDIIKMDMCDNILIIN